MQIEGTAALITGGASGMGAACARTLAGAGSRVTLVDMQADKGKALAEELGGGARFVEADVTNEEAVQAAVDAAVDGPEPLRVAINCAGIGWAQRTVNKDGTPHDLGVFAKVIQI